ncbi:MAG: SPOR domain-containing protein, partial [Fluviicola sp.]
MNNYLLQLLKEVNMLIIPGLGAINIVNKSTGEFMFMNYMKHDDGTLAKHIAEKEGWEINDAKNLIAKFVREVNAQLDKGETYDMFQFGSFKKVNGDVEFEQWNAASDTNSSLEPEIESKTEELKEEIIAETPEKTEIPDIPLIIEEPIVEKTIESLSESTTNEETPSIEEVITPNEVAELQPVETSEPEPVIQSIRSTNLDELLAKNEVEESSIENIDEPKVEKKIELNVIDKSIESTPEQIIEPTIEKEIPKEKIEKVISEPEVKIVEPVKPVQAKETLQQTKDKKKAEKEIKATTPVKVKKKTKPYVYILWGFVVLILGASTFVAVKFDSLKKDFPFLAEWAGDKTTEDVGPTKIDEDINSNGNDASESEEPTQEVEIPEETVQEEVPVEEEKVEEVKIEKPVKSVSKPKKETSKPAKTTSTPKPKRNYSSSSSASSIDSSLPFHIIAGSFGSKENANRLANKLKANGFTSAAIEDRGGSFRVSAKGFSSKDAALSELSSVQSIAPGSW